jgi:peptidoglycan/LPS O-acetylase OafA/YrhL
MAIWVMISHLLKMSGEHLRSGPLWNIFANPQYAVQTFMILSGFVIALVIDRRQESYRDFITRRLFRIYPVFFMATCAGIALHGIWGDLIHQQWPGLFTKDTLQMFTAIWQATNDNLPAYVAAVLSMTNGMIPDSLMPHVAVAFIGVVWSLSLEFQFYLISPFLCKRLASTGPTLLGILGAIILFVTFRQMILGPARLSTYVAFLPCSIEFFVIGILSYHLYLWCRHNRDTLVQLFGNNRISFLLAFVILFLLVAADKNRLLLKGQLVDITGDWTAILIWLLTLGWLVDGDLGTQSRLHRIGDIFFHSRIALFLGRISYSVYLWHMPVIFCVQWFLFRTTNIHTWQELLIRATLATIPITLLVSWLSYRWIEKPFMQLGACLIERRTMKK